MSKPDLQDSKSYDETDAYKKFVANLGRLTGLVQLLKPTQVIDSVATIKEFVSKLPGVDVARLSGAVSNLSEAVNLYVRTRGLVYDWMSVMLVTFLEAYLEEGLLFLTGRNPKLLAEVGPLDSQTVLEAGSIDELRAELQQQWARKTLRVGGPKAWRKRLKALGARDYSEESVQDAQHLWDTRNLIVHAQGAADRTYIKKYPNPALRVGGRITVSPAQFLAWVNAVGDFAKTTERFFQSYAGPRAD